MGSLYLGCPTIQEVDGKMMMGLSIYGVAVISGSLYSRFYSICIKSFPCRGEHVCTYISGFKCTRWQKTTNRHTHTHTHAGQPQ